MLLINALVRQSSCMLHAAMVDCWFAATAGPVRWHAVALPPTAHWASWPHSVMSGSQRVFRS